MLHILLQLSSLNGEFTTQIFHCYHIILYSQYLNKTYIWVFSKDIILLHVLRPYIKWLRSTDYRLNIHAVKCICWKTIHTYLIDICLIYLNLLNKLRDLTPRIWVLFEKPKVIQLFKNFQYFTKLSTDCKYDTGITSVQLVMLFLRKFMFLICATSVHPVTFLNIPLILYYLGW
jgi:hypothetical protein